MHGEEAVVFMQTTVRDHEEAVSYGKKIIADTNAPSLQRGEIIRNNIQKDISHHVYSTHHADSASVAKPDMCAGLERNRTWHHSNSTLEGAKNASPRTRVTHHSYHEQDLR